MRLSMEVRDFNYVSSAKIVVQAKEATKKEKMGLYLKYSMNKVKWDTTYPHQEAPT